MEVGIQKFMHCLKIQMRSLVKFERVLVSLRLVLGGLLIQTGKGGGNMCYCDLKTGCWSKDY